MCPDCKHPRHEPGQCSSCNCRESEVVGMAENLEALGWQDSQGRIVSTDGYRAKPMRGLMIGEYGFE